MGVSIIGVSNYSEHVTVRSQGRRQRGAKLGGAEAPPNFLETFFLKIVFTARYSRIIKI